MHYGRPDLTEPWIGDRTVADTASFRRFANDSLTIEASQSTNSQINRL